jgi:deazaflavin-dependent oxidoreductase (nitroreductase family)
VARPYRSSPGRRALNLVVRPLARYGLAGRRTHLLTVRGRRTGRLWSTPVSLVEDGGVRWLVAPVADRQWVRNARAAGWVELRRGRRRERPAVVELPPEQAVPVLRRYVELSRLTRRLFEAGPGSPDEAWLAESSRHVVFRLEPRGEGEPST